VARSEPASGRPVSSDGHGWAEEAAGLFRDRKIARQRRDLVPLVVDEQDRIVWVAGFGIDETFA